jgi:chemotaxis protein MotB
MIVKYVNRILVLFALAVFVAGCASTNLPEPEHEPRPGSQVSDNVDAAEDTGAETAEEESTSEADEITSKANEIDDVSARHSGDVVALTLDQKILFELGKAEIKRTAWPALDEIAKLIVEYPERMVMVQGHTDDLPTRTERFPSNWDLSAQRAVNVVKYIANLPGLDKSRLVAAGMGEHHPRVPNTSAENRQLNRRVEIVMYPSDLPEITVPVPQP